METLGSILLNECLVGDQTIQCESRHFPVQRCVTNAIRRMHAKLQG